VAKKRTTRLFSWNVNGIRACWRKGFLDWLAEARPDVLGLQETRALPEQLESDLLHPDGYQVHYHPAERKGYSGVALYTRSEPESVVLGGLDEPAFDDEGRLIIADYGDFLFYTGYFPNGGNDLSRVPYKLEFSEAVLQHAESSAATSTRLTRRSISPTPSPTKRTQASCPWNASGSPASLTTATSIFSAGSTRMRRAATPGGATAWECANATSAGVSIIFLSLPTSRRK
jgi:hypothetical protein